MLWSRSASIQMIGTSSGICSTANCLTAVRLMIFVRSAHAKPSSAIAQLTVTSDGPKSCSAIRVARRNPALVFSWPTTEYWTMPVVRSLITYSSQARRWPGAISTQSLRNIRRTRKLPRWQLLEWLRWSTAYWSVGKDQKADEGRHKGRTVEPIEKVGDHAERKYKRDDDGLGWRFCLYQARHYCQ